MKDWTYEDWQEYYNGKQEDYDPWELSEEGE